MKFDFDLKAKGPHKKIVFLGVAITVFIAVFLLSVYMPARRKMGRLRDEYIAIKGQIDEIQKVAGGGEELDVTYKKLYKSYNKINRKLMSEAGFTLSALSTEADKMGIDVLAITPEEAAGSNLPVKIEGHTILRMPISMNIRCNYVKLGEYIGLITDELDCIIPDTPAYIPESGRMYRANRERAAEFINRFRKTFGSVECKDIHTKIWGKTYDLRKPEDYTYFMKRPQHDQ